MACCFSVACPQEEQLMLKSFGDDYCKYMEQTYRLVPGIY
jgi:protein-S-isoprenylcysteine O-methyltransferase Ste14